MDGRTGGGIDEWMGGGRMGRGMDGGTDGWMMREEEQEQFEATVDGPSP